MNKDIIVIADTQAYKGAPVAHLKALSKYIWAHKPKTLIHIGDNFDFPSLSTYASAMEKEGKRLVDDLEGGKEAIRLVMEFTHARNKSAKRKPYKPDLHFIMGNHENRLHRYIDENPHLLGCIDIEGFLKEEGWTVHKFLEPYFLNDICFIHYMPSAESARPVGGSIDNKLNKFPHSFVHGHQQKFQFGRRQNMEGRPHFGVCAGSFYMHDEGYRGANNTEIRGFVHLKAYTNRYGYLDHDVEFVSLERLLAEYGDEQCLLN